MVGIKAQWQGRERKEEELSGKIYKATTKSKHLSALQQLRRFGNGSENRIINSARTSHPRLHRRSSSNRGSAGLADGRA